MAQLFRANTQDAVRMVGPLYPIVSTISVWTRCDSTSAGRIFEAAGPSGSHMLRNNSTTDYRWDVSFTFTSGVFTVPRPTTGMWTHVVLTYDGRATANVPGIYFDGVPQPVTVDTAPSGSFRTNHHASVWGNRPAGGAYNAPWIGLLAEGAVWKRILPVGDIGRLASGVPPPRVAPDMLWYYAMSPFAHRNVGFALNPGTGRWIYAAHPPTLHPLNARHVVLTAAGVAGRLVNRTPLTSLVGGGLAA